MKKIAVLSIAAVLAAGCFVGCGSDDSSKKSSGSKYAGKYEVSKIVSDDQEITTLPGGSSIATFIQFELTDDGKAIGWDADKGEEEKDVATWSVDGSELKIFEDEDKDPVMTLKIEGDELVMDETSGKAYLSKVSEYTTIASTEANED